MLNCPHPWHLHTLVCAVGSPGPVNLSQPTYAWVQAFLSLQSIQSLQQMVSEALSRPDEGAMPLACWDNASSPQGTADPPGPTPLSLPVNPQLKHRGPAGVRTQSQSLLILSFLATVAKF